MILFLFADSKRARSAGFVEGRHGADHDCIAWWPECDPERLRGRVFERVIKVDRMLLTRVQYEEIRVRLRDHPATWIEL